MRSLAVFLAAAVSLLSIPALAGPTMRGQTIIRADPGQTTASTKIFKVQNAAGTEEASIDIEGDLACGYTGVGHIAPEESILASMKTILSQNASAR